jgi:hypothetical protein
MHRFPQETFQNILLQLAVAFGVGLVIAIAYRIKNPSNRSFLMALVILPVVVQTLIMLLNRTDSLGLGIAIAGAFTLVRFRSVPGTAMDLAAVFLSMVTGVAIGGGYLWLALFFAPTASALLVAIRFIPYPQTLERRSSEKQLRITIPEDLDYDTEFEPILKEYTKSFLVVRLKTSAMGSLFIIDYRIVLKPNVAQKELIDKLRVKNSNLPVVLTRFVFKEEDL